MVFILRLQTSIGVKRLLFENDQKTLKDVILQCKDVLRINPSALQISRTRLNNPNFINMENLKATLKSLNLKHGMYVYMYVVYHNISLVALSFMYMISTFSHICMFIFV